MTKDATIQLETKLAFQEDLLQRLDEAVSAQQQQIMRLEDQVRLLSDQLRRVSDELPQVKEEPPPHY